MKRIACLLLGAAIAGNGCLGVQHIEVSPPPAAHVEPPPPPVLPGQVTEANAPQVLQALSDELDRAVAESAPPAPAPPPRP